MTEAEVYSLIVTGDLPRATCISIIRSYGNRKVIEAFDEARKTTPGSKLSLDEVEMEKRVMACIESLDEILTVTIGGVRQEAE